jgi:hypothetical protein
MRQKNLTVFKNKTTQRGFILSLEKYVTQMSPTISQTPLQSYSKIFYHPTSHRRDFFLYALL